MAERIPKRTGEHRERFWVVHQHHDVTVVQTQEQPSSEVEEGERIKRVYGPFLSKEVAQERRDDIYSRTTKANAERAGVI